MDIYTYIYIHPVCHTVHEALNLYLSAENGKRMSVSFSGESQINVGNFSAHTPSDRDNLQS